MISWSYEDPKLVRSIGLTKLKIYPKLIGAKASLSPLTSFVDYMIYSLNPQPMRRNN